ncbi:disease resistance protein RPV1-like isoform X1 [Vitis riparia]|uniref:disease resistance protein RPV1-like isoform X1 n=1 Tax=Vitis riparia TaxID=96939 RepID=UPI00155AF7E6|nr:disease resistance protein RPV1-like isoform X1 [Vitis riparia]
MSYDVVVSTPTSSTTAFRHRWDVFLSFRGEDTRHNFTDHLYTQLDRNGIRAFRDNEGLNRGDDINSGLLDAIEDSAAFIAIISPNYASSRWCLEELAKVCECRRLILPVFYQVDPSDVRRQKGRFHEDFGKLEARFGEDKVLRWRKAMKKAGGIAGWVFNGDGRSSDEEPNLIQTLVKRVLAELNNTPLSVAAYTVGLDSRIEELLNLLDIKSNGIRVLGFHGMGGVGKTTLAKALYNKLVAHFECRSFISNVKETLAQQDEDSLLSLHNKLINDLSMSEASPVSEVNAGLVAIRRIMHEKRVLLVMDDVDDASQLEVVIGRRKWRQFFYGGSRIIITTRDRGVLRDLHENELFEVQGLNFSESLQLFSYHALRREKPTEDFWNLSNEIVSLTGGLPLALEVFGSFLYDKRIIKEWEDALQKLKQIRPSNLQDVLKISFDGLDEQEKDIFLDIACFFVKMRLKREDAIDILKGCGFRADITIKVLTEKSLIKTYEDGILWMHDQLRDMGKQIVQHENPSDPGSRSRLWDHNEVMSVLQDQTGTRSIQGIVPEFKKKDASPESSSQNKLQTKHKFTRAILPLKKTIKECFHHKADKERVMTLCTKSFQPMVTLRLLQINHVQLGGNFKNIPAELKWLQWKGCPLKTLPSTFCPRKLTVLDLSESKIERVWGCHNKKVAENLMVMNLSGCNSLTDLPDVSGHQALEKLILERCLSLVTIHKSVGDLRTLLHLNLMGCSNLLEFPSDVSGLRHLEILNLSGCTKLKELPEDMSSMTSLRELLVDKTAIVKLPDSIFRLKKLEKFSLDSCSSLEQLPYCIGKLSSLRELSLNGSALEELPDSIGSLTNLERLSLMRCRLLSAIPDSLGRLRSLIELFICNSSIKELPASIGSLSQLRYLSLSHCRSLIKLPDSIEGLVSLARFQLDGTLLTGVPDQVGSLNMLETLEMRNCEIFRSFPEINNMSSLTTLILDNSLITELPESIGNLERLNMLMLNNCKQLQRLPASIRKLKNLCSLLMKGTAVTELPEKFGMLSNLRTLKMAKRPDPEATGEHMELTNLILQENPKPVVLPMSFSNLFMLKELDARAWKISGSISYFEKLSSLEDLNLGHNNFCSLPSSLQGLSVLKNLFLPHCKEIKSLPPLPSSLIKLNVSNCCALQSVSDLSNLKSLEDLNLTNCKKIMDIPGLQCLRSLKRFYASGCNACLPALKSRITKVALKHLYNLSVPGSEIPNWFVQEIPCFSSHRNLKVTGVVIGVVVCVSVNPQMHNAYSDKVPVIVDVQAKLFRRNEDKPVHSTTLKLEGVADTNEDQLYLCRFLDFKSLVLMLKDGDKIQVAVRDEPRYNGLVLKKYGIHLIFENDDDEDEDEEGLDESQQSISERLVKFLKNM